MVEDSTIEQEEFSEIERVFSTDDEDWRYIRDQLVGEVKRCWRKIEHLENANRRLQAAIRDNQ